MAIFFYFSLFVFIASCGQSDLYNKLEMAARKQESINGMTQELFSQGPVESSGNSNISSSSDLDLVPRDLVVIEGLLDPKAPLESIYLKIFESSEKSEAPSFFQWAGRRISWKDSDFQIFMGYYHGYKAQAFLEEALGRAKLKWDFAVNTGNGFATKTTIYAVENGSPFQTGYDVSQKTISFFKDPEAALPKYNPIDEATAIYHEFGHVAMHALRRNIVEMSIGENQDLDALQEGLADFIAAAVADNSEVLRYFSNNVQELIPESNRNGNSQIRLVENDLYFPKAYTGQINLDGRIVSGALNDFKKYLSGARLKQLSKCSGTSCDIAARPSAVSSREAYKKVAKLALLAFEDIVETSTLHDYASKVLAKCQGTLDVCSTTNDSVVLQKILIGRGLLFSTVVPWNALLDYTFAGFGGLEDFQMALEIGVLPFPDDAGFANNNGILDPCEVMMIFPKFKNNSGVGSGRDPLEIRNWKVNLAGVEGFQPLRVGTPVQSVEVIPSLGSSAVAETKTWGWMSPGENADDSSVLINSLTSPWYRANLGSPFTQRLGAHFYPSPLGWIVRAPTFGTAVSARFRVEFQPANTDTVFVMTHDDPNTVDDEYFKPNGVDFPSLTVGNPQITGANFCESSS